VIIVDASVALAWCLSDEEDAFAERALERAASERAAAPVHWALEVANGLLTAERRGRLREADVERAGRFLADLDVEIVPVELFTATGSVLDLARKHKLSAYDAAYLGLAWFRGVPLATIDAKLRAACAAEGVPLAA
jgi:predicted nucleic acid-binding protein